MTTIQQQALHWRDRAIAHSEIISDGWQVFLAWAGRGAEIILFVCMAISLIQMIPTISLPDLFTGAVFVVQMITLDVAGFGLNSLAKAVRRAGDEETAKKAEAIGTSLLIIMVVSMLSGGIDRLFGTRFPAVKDWMIYLDDALILIRIGMTVLYGKIMHALRDSQQHTAMVADETEARLREELAQTQEKLEQEREANVTMKAGQETTITDLSQQLAEMKANLERKNAELSRTQESLRNALHDGSILKASIGEKELSLQAKMQAAVKAAREEMQALMKVEALREQGKLQAEMDELKRANAELKAQLKAPMKAGKQVAAEKFDARQFVFSCLQKDPTMKLSAIVQAAKMKGQELSEPTISRYRKEYRESAPEPSHESSAR